MTELSSHSASPAFVTTRWTQVLSARGSTPEARAALSELCGAYYEPVFAFIRRSARPPEAAQDLTHEFFARLLGGAGIDRLQQGQGRFRSFLLGAVKHFLADLRDREVCVKRGGGARLESLDAGDEPLGESLQSEALHPDREFDRKWALTILGLALQKLEREHLDAGRSELFQALKPWLTGDQDDVAQAEVATRLGLQEGTLKVTIFRLRRRFRAMLKSEVAQTIQDPSQAGDELGVLLAALSPG